MRKYLIFLLFLTIAYSQSVLNANCAVQADKYGFVELQAYAGYFDASMNFYCYNTNVSVSVAGTDYAMDQLYTCDYVRLLQLPIGQYDIAYNAVYPDFESQTVQCQLNVTLSKSLNLVVYGLKSGDSFKPNAIAHIETVAVLDDRNVDAAISAKLMQGTTVVRDITLTKDVLGTTIGNILLNVSEGQYSISILAAYENLSVQKEIAVIVNSTQGAVYNISGLNVLVLEPENIVYPEDSDLNLQVELQDENRGIVSGASVKADVYKGSEKIDTVQLKPAMWFYQGTYLFEDTGEYRVVFTATKGYSTATSSVNFVLGNVSEISKAVNFTVKIISPLSSVYMRDSIMTAKVKLTKDEEPVANASVLLMLDGQQITMRYDRFGEYLASIGPLDEGDYEMKIIATKDDLVAQDKVTFMVSRHILNIDTISPYYNQEFSLKEADALRVKAIVLDEDGDVVSGALVIAKIMEPDGKAVQMQLFQDKVTGDYSANFYLSKLDGTYELTVEASKAGYVSMYKDSQFSVTFEKEQVQIFSQWVTVENLLYIVLGVAILILLAAILRAVF